MIEGDTREQHCNGEEDYCDIRNCARVSLYLLESVLKRVEFVGLFVHLFEALVGTVISYRLKQSAHTVEHEARERA